VPGSKNGTAVSVNSFTVDNSTAKMKGEVNGTCGNRGRGRSLCSRGGPFDSARGKLRPLYANGKAPAALHSLGAF
jgi:hypothetical protein